MRGWGGLLFYRAGGRYIPPKRAKKHAKKQGSRQTPKRQKPKTTIFAKKQGKKPKTRQKAKKRYFAIVFI